MHSDSHSVDARPDIWLGCRVMLVENSPTEHTVLEEMLQPLGCNTINILSSELATDLLKTDDYDLVIVNSDTAAIDQIAAVLTTRRLETGSSHWTPVIALGNEDFAHHPEHFLSTGLDDYLLRPVRREALLAVLRRWLPTTQAASKRILPHSQTVFPTTGDIAHTAATGLFHRYQPVASFDDNPGVLLASGDPGHQQAGLRTLEKNGLEVTLAEDGLQALALIRHAHPDLIILSASLPRLDGFEVCRQLRSLPGTRYTPIIMILEENDMDAAQRAFELQATDFVTSPVRWQNLLQRIRYNLRAAQVFLDLKRSEQRLANAEAVANLGYWDWDMTNDIFYMSEHASQVLGHPRDALTNLADYLKVLHPEDMDRFYKELEMKILNGDNWMLEYRVITAQGDVRIIRGDGATYPNDSSWSMGTLLDITAQRRNEETIRRMAFYDDLTGLHNRVSFRDELTRSIKLHERLHVKLAVMYMDLDGFKRVNDSLGHHVGDLLLKAFGDRVVSQLRDSDIVGHDMDPSTVARLGGDEFTILLTGLGRGADAGVAVQRIIDSLAEPFVLKVSDGECHEIHIGCSIGIAIAPEDGNSATELLNRADNAMYAAKQAGKNTYRFFSACDNT